MAENCQKPILPNAAPTITVAMPVYNAGKYLRSAVLSIVKQTFTDWELLIVDDGSTDDALDHIRDIIEADSRIRVFRDGVNKGLAARLNECIDMARGCYLARMDQDDIAYPTRVAIQLQRLQECPPLDLVATRVLTINEANEAIGLLPWFVSHTSICAHPWLGFYLPHPTWMGRTAWFKKYRYAQPAPYFCEDQELLLRSYMTSRFDTVDQVLLAYRVRSHTPYRKLFRTRWAVFMVQVRSFVAMRRYLLVCAALMALGVRIIRDLLPAAKMRKARVPRQELDEWRSVLSQIERQGK